MQSKNLHHIELLIEKLKLFLKNLDFTIIKKGLFIFLGSLLASIALEIFLVPNNVIDGGIVGISIMLSYFTNLPLGLFIFVLNIPFLVIGYKQIGKTFLISTIFAITTLSIGVSLLHPISGVTKDIFLATVFGGIILGVGVGLIIRYGGSLDGAEIMAIILDKKVSFSVGEIVLFFNIFILASAGFVFGWDRAMYSIVAYFIAFKVIDLTIEGLDESKSCLIISEKSDILAETIMARLGRGVTFFEGKGAYTGTGKKILYTVITRLEEAKLKLIIKEIDPQAFVTVSKVHEVMGGRFKKNAIH